MYTLVERQVCGEDWRWTGEEGAAACGCALASEYSLAEIDSNASPHSPSQPTPNNDYRSSPSTCDRMANQTQVQATSFQLVLERFKASLTDKEKSQFGATTLHDLHIAIETIQKQQASEKRLQGMHRLEVFLEGMKEYDKVIQVFLNSGMMLAFVWVRWLAILSSLQLTFIPGPYEISSSGIHSVPSDILCTKFHFE